MDTIFELILFGVFGFMMKKMIDQTFQVSADLLNNALTSFMDKAAGWLKGLSEMLVSVFALSLRAGVMGLAVVFPQLFALGSGVINTVLDKVTKVTKKKKNPLAKNDNSLPADPSKGANGDPAEDKSANSQPEKKSNPPQPAPPQPKDKQGGGGKTPPLSDPELEDEREKHAGMLAANQMKTDKNNTTMAANQAIIDNPDSTVTDKDRAEQENTKIASDNEEIAGSNKTMNDEFSAKSKANHFDKLAKEADHKAAADAIVKAQKQAQKASRLSEAPGAYSPEMEAASLANPTVAKHRDKVQSYDKTNQALRLAEKKAKRADDGTLLGGFRSSIILGKAKMNAAAEHGRGGRTGLVGAVGAAGAMLTQAMGPLGESGAFKHLAGEAGNLFAAPQDGFKFLETPKVLENIGNRAIKSAGSVGDISRQRKLAASDSIDFFDEDNDEGQNEIQETNSRTQQAQMDAESTRLAQADQTVAEEKAGKIAKDTKANNANIAAQEAADNQAELDRARLEHQAELKAALIERSNLRRYAAHRKLINEAKKRSAAKKILWDAEQKLSDDAAKARDDAAKARDDAVKVLADANKTAQKERFNNIMAELDATIAKGEAERVEEHNKAETAAQTSEVFKVPGPGQSMEEKTPTNKTLKESVPSPTSVAAPETEDKNGNMKTERNTGTEDKNGNR